MLRLLPFFDGKDESDCGILVQFQDGKENPSSWTSVSLNIVGQSRDWAFLTASDLEERLKKIKTLSTTYIFQNKWAITIPLFIGIGVYFLALSLLPPEISAAEKLKSAYKSDLVKDPIEVLILLERVKETRTPYMRTFLILVLSYTFLLGTSWLLSKILPIISPSYNFYWGDYIEFYNMREGLQSVFWTVIVLGIIVSIASAYILRFLP